MKSEGGHMDEVVIKVRDNGPYRVSGHFKLIDATDGEFTLEGEVIALCRCGHSEHKPFCDGTHRKVEFKSEPRAAEQELD
jgi:CDGSH-type Zn-finger protein